MVDLEELLGRVRDASAKEQIREAINCYHAGAYRSSIVSTWVAVVFDFVGKLRELDMTGNQAARAKLQQLETIRANHELPKLLSFEKELVKAAKSEFDLISPVEAIDLERLFEDRNRCAHPSLTALDDVFRPSAELARAHIVATIHNMLSQPPIQGTAAATRVFAEILSEYFPVSAPEAAEYLRHGPLGRAKDTLIRSVVIGITKDLMTESRGTPDRKKQFAALNAVRMLYPDKFSQVASANLKRIAEGLDETQVKRLVLYVGQVPTTWDHLGSAAQLKCQNFIASASPGSIDASLLRALEVPALRDRAASRIDEFGSSALARMLQGRVEPLFKERCLLLTERSGSFRDAESNMRSLILPFGSTLTEGDMRRIAEAFRDNAQIRYANDVVPILQQLFQKGASQGEHQAGWEVVYKALCEAGDDRDSFTQLTTLLASRYSFPPCDTASVTASSAVDLDEI